MSEKELELYKSLIRLGDSPKLALKTVLMGRGKVSNSNFYDHVYRS